MAFAVVDAETEENWYWFLSELNKVIAIGRDITFVSDRNLGLLDALPRVFPNSNHLYCLEHLKRNLRDRFRGRSCSNQFREHVVWLFRECAYASSEEDFFDKLEKLKQEGGRIVQSFLEGLPVESWTNAFSKCCRYGEMSSNAAESFNAWIMDVRDLHITHMVDTIRLKLMKWFSERRERGRSWNGILCPNMLKKLNICIRDGRTFSVKKSSDSIYEVLSVVSTSVDIHRRVCSCKMWQLNGFPCVHACAVITTQSLPLNELVEPFFHVSSYKNSYGECIYPIPTEMVSERFRSDDVDIIPPSSSRPPGRPKKRRFRSKGEEWKSIKCGRCGKMGHHNKKTCREALP